VIVLLETIHPDAHRLLEDVDEVRVTVSPTELDSDISPPDVRAIVLRGRGRVPASWFPQLPNLTVVGRCGAGLDNIDTAAAAAAGVTVVHAPGSTTSAVSEHAVLLMLALARRLTTLNAAVRSGRWSIRDGYEGMDLGGRCLGIVGLGAIGRRIADLGAALGMDVVYWSRRSRHPALRLVPLDQLVAMSDVIQVCVASTPHTVGLIGAEQLRRMKPTTLIVNTARGNVVDHGALRRALTERAIGGYASDVWDPEPPTPGDPLVADERVIVTYRKLCLRPAEAIVAILSGRDPDPTTVHTAHPR